MSRGIYLITHKMKTDKSPSHVSKLFWQV